MPTSSSFIYLFIYLFIPLYIPSPHDIENKQASHVLWGSAGLKVPIHAHFWVVLGFWPVK